MKRLAIPARIRREVALRFGAIPGRAVDAACVYCGRVGSISWPMLHFSKRPGSWVHFDGLHLDHIEPYSKGGSNQDPENFTLACRRCNSSKGPRTPEQWKAAQR
jgi:5-methylcytosine-specific restriction endonuclease McrA